VIGVGTKIRAYEIVAHLRGGGMATLFLGRRIGAAGFNKLVAVKVVHPHLAKDPSFVQMFVDEALLSSRIQHPNVVHVEELGQAEDTYFLVMEYVHGVSLSQLLTALAKLGRRLTPELAVHVAIKVAEGLHAAHETTGDDGQPLGVVHRDISPQNVLLSSRGHVKLIDFGIAKAAGRIQQTTGASLKGKIRYMSPEQAFGRPVDRRTDVYALGIVLWEMLTMRRMFTAEDDFALLELVRNPQHRPPSTHCEGLPSALDRAVLRALAADVGQRTPTALEFRRELAAAMPSALALDEQCLADLVVTACAKDLEAERQVLSSLAKGTPVTDVTGATPAPKPQAIENLTASASHLRMLPPEEGLVSEMSPPAVSVAVPLEAQPPTPTAGASGHRRSPLVFAVGAVALLLAGGGAGFAVVSMRRGEDDVRATPTALPSSPGAQPVWQPVHPTVPPLPANTAEVRSSGAEGAASAAFPDAGMARTGAPGTGAVVAPGSPAVPTGAGEWPAIPPVVAATVGPPSAGASGGPPSPARGAIGRRKRGAGSGSGGSGAHASGGSSGGDLPLANSFDD
jgi:serine/threonine-protein kinase